MTPATRSATFAALKDDLFDVLVIGGGITGAGVARDAALRGLKVALVDKGDFGAGTSSKSSKLIHGGLRYLQHAEFGLVFESVNERTRLLRLAPHLVRPLSFLVPAYKGQVPGLFALDCGLWIYDALSKFASPRRHRTYRGRRILSLEPGLSAEGLRGGIVYYDSMTDDARLTLENIIDAREHGARVASYTRVTGFLLADPASPDSAVTGVQVVDALDPSLSASVRARVTVNATGPWSDGLLSLVLAAPGADRGPLLRPTKGVHVVLDAARLPVQHALVMVSPRDARVLFAIPWSEPEAGAAGRTVLGTTDTFFAGDPDQVAADAADIDYLLSCANHYFPAAHLTESDVLATWAGLRPLVAPPTKADLSASEVSREHRLIRRQGLLTIAGGKLTTFRKMAAQVVDAVLGQLGRSAKEVPCRTATTPLPGARDLPGQKAEEGEGEPKGQKRAKGRKDGVALLSAQLLSEGIPGVDAQVAQHLARTYGTRARQIVDLLRSGDATASERLDPELPYLMAEVDLAVAQEEALRLEDVLARRVPLLLRARDQGLSCAERVATRMAALLFWTDERRQAETERYRQVVDLSRQFRPRSGRPHPRT